MKNKPENIERAQRLVAPDPIPEATEPEPSALDGDAASNVEDDATSTDETPLDENAVAIDAPETSEA